MSNAKNITLSDVIAFIASADRATRRIVNQHILDMGKEEDRAAIDTFRYGDKVKFVVNKRPYYGSAIVGTIVKRNQKTVEVKPDGGGRNWKVSASLLNKA